MGGHAQHVCSRVGGGGRRRAIQCNGLAVRTRRQVRALPDLPQRTLALRAAPGSRRSRLPSDVRRRCARSKDAAVTRHALPPLATIAVAALMVAGCSTTPSETGTGGTAGTGKSVTNREKAMKFAGCMRDNGVAEFPDPNASGELTIDAVANGSSLDTNSATFKKAISACKDLQPSGFMG